MAKIDLRTERQKQIDKKRSDIAKMFNQLKTSQPGASDHRIMSAIAEKYNLTVMGVRYILRNQAQDKQV